MSAAKRIFNSKRNQSKFLSSQQHRRQAGCIWHTRKYLVYVWVRISHIRSPNCAEIVQYTLYLNVIFTFIIRPIIEFPRRQLLLMMLVQCNVWREARPRLFLLLVGCYPIPDIMAFGDFAECKPGRMGKI